jgi:hypothetical protein
MVGKSGGWRDVFAGGLGGGIAAVEQGNCHDEDYEKQDSLNDA